MTGPAWAFLPDGRRLHLQHGPTDLIIEVFAADAVRMRAHARAIARFRGLLAGLVRDLPALRRPVDAAAPLADPVARRMRDACLPHAGVFVTPMAAVAGAIADEILAAMVAGLPVDRAYVNNGGDVAIHLGPGQHFDAAIWDGGGGGRLRVAAGDGVGGIATSGWRGRSHSLGIADAVTVLARSAAAADAAATLIANAVDLPGHPAITRRPARTLSPDSDLGDRPVTVAVGPLAPAEVAAALDRGLAAARDMLERGLIRGAALFLRGETRALGLPAPPTPRELLPCQSSA